MDGQADEEQAVEEQAIQKSLLSDKAILHFMKSGLIVIEPFSRPNLGTSSYDVRSSRL